MKRIQHYMNSLHIFCYLVALGFSKPLAKKLACTYERFIHPLIY